MQLKTILERLEELEKNQVLPATIAIFLLLFFKQYITSFEQLATWV